jgi:uncharacterized alpha-E superfamily protein
MMLSRVADSLYWMARYLERAEHMARVLDVQLHIALDVAPHTASLGWICLLNSLRFEMPAEISADARAVTNALAFDPASPCSIVSCVGQARENARQIREQIPTEMWEELNNLYLSMRDMNTDRLWAAGPHAFFRGVQRGAQLVAGLSDSALNHGEGWQFIRLGRYLERAIVLAWLLDSHFGMRGAGDDREATPSDFVAWAGLLRTCSAYEAYCRVHTVELQPRRILDFLLLNVEFPHAVRFCARQIDKAVTGIAGWTGTAHVAPACRLAGRLNADLAYGTIDEVLAGDLGAYLNSVVRSGAAVHDAVYNQYISYTVDAVLQGELVEA